MRQVVLALVVIVIIAAALTTFPPRVHAQAKLNELTLNAGEEHPCSAVIDTDHGYAYFGICNGLTTPGGIVKIRLSDFTRVGAITLLDAANPSAAVIGYPYAYFGTYSYAPAKVVQIDLTTFSEVDSDTLPAEATWLTSAVVDLSGNALFGTYTVPARVVKVPIGSSFGSPVTVLTLSQNPSADCQITSAVIDSFPPQGDAMAYFGTSCGQGHIEMVDLSTFTQLGSMTASGLGYLTSAVADNFHRYAYFGTDEGEVVKFNLNTHQIDGRLMLPESENGLSAAVIDTVNGYAYFGADAGNGYSRIVKVDLQSFSRAGAITLPPYEYNPGYEGAGVYLESAVFDAASGYGYFGASTWPWSGMERRGMILKIAPSPSYSVVRGMDSGIYFGSYGGKEWNRLPGATADSPAAVRCSGGLHIAVRGTNNGIYYGYFDFSTKTFSGWLQVPGKTSSAPALSTDQYCSVLYLVVRGMDSGVYVNMRTSGTWGNWIKLPGATVDGPAAAYAAGSDPPILHIVVRGKDGSSIWHGQAPVIGNTLGFWGWSQIQGKTPSKPALLAISEWQIYLAVRGLDNGIHVNKWDGYSWKGWVKLPTGTTTDAPSIAVSGPSMQERQQLFVAVRGMDNGVYWCQAYIDWNYGWPWYGWNKLHGSTPSSPTLAS